MNRTSARVHLALIVVQLCFSGFHVVGRSVLDTVHPLALAGVRVAFAAPMLLTLSWFLHRVRPAVRDLPYLAMLGLFGVFINQLLFIIGLSHTTAVNAGILMPAIPVLAVAFGALFRIERLTAHTVVGIALAVAGALVMLDVTSFDLTAERTLGNALILINCASYALFLVLNRPVLRRYPPMVVTGWAFLFGGIGIFALSLPHLVATDWSSVGNSTLAGIAYSALVPTTFAYFLNAWSIKRSSPTVAASYTMLQPVGTGVLAVIFLGETVGRREFIGFALIVVGLSVVTGLLRGRDR